MKVVFCAVVQDALVCFANGKIIPHVVGAYASPRRKLPDLRHGGDLFFNGEKCILGLGIPARTDTVIGDHGAALEIDRELLLKSTNKALFCSQADILQRMRLRYRLEQDILPLDLLQRHLFPLVLRTEAGFHLGTPLFDPAFEHLQLLDAAIDDHQLLLERCNGPLHGVMFHVFFDLVQGETDLFQDQDGVQIIQLCRAVITVAVAGVGIGWAEQPDLIIVDQCLPGNILMFG